MPWQLATQQHVVELVHPFAELKTFGALVVRCQALRFPSTPASGSSAGTRPCTSVSSGTPSHRPSSAGAANVATFGQHAGRGQAGGPGMYLNSLTPVPEAQADVDLLTALVRYDALVEAGNRRQLLTIGLGLRRRVPPAGTADRRLRRPAAARGAAAGR